MFGFGRFPQCAGDDAIPKVGALVTGGFADVLIPGAISQRGLLRGCEQAENFTTEVMVGDPLVKGAVQPDCQPTMQFLEAPLPFPVFQQRQFPCLGEEEAAEDIAFVVETLDARLLTV